MMRHNYNNQQHDEYANIVHLPYTLLKSYYCVHTCAVPVYLLALLLLLPRSSAGSTACDNFRRSAASTAACRTASRNHVCAVPMQGDAFDPYHDSGSLVTVALAPPALPAFPAACLLDLAAGAAAPTPAPALAANPRTAASSARTLTRVMG